MSKEVSIIVRCDQCEGPNAETYTVLNSQGKAVEIDLDEKCHAKIHAPLLALADDRGVIPEKASKANARPKSSKTADKQCLFCSESRGSDNGLLGHMADKHGVPKSNSGVFGTMCPLDGETHPRLAQHIAQKHREFNHISQAFVYARDHGDEYGVVKAVLDKTPHIAA